MWKIPLFDLVISQNERDAVDRVLSSGWLTMGSVTKEFEKCFAQFLGVRHAIAVSSGTAALHLANMALGIREGDEVICPSLTFVAGPNSILYVGARPVFADIEGTAYPNISPEDIAHKIGPRTKAIQVVHYAGRPCRMDAICDIAKRRQLRIIEDCAHAPGARYQGRMCGSIGDIGCFSFFSNKNMTTAEGGVVVTDDDGLAEKINLMRSHGMTRSTIDRYHGGDQSYDVVSLGYNYRMDEIRAALGIEQLEKLPQTNQRRSVLTQVYRDRLSGCNGLQPAFTGDDTLDSYASANHILAAVLDNEKFRWPLMNQLASYGIQTSIHYPPVHLFDFYRRIPGGGKKKLPFTEAAGKREITLPLYPSMSENDVAVVCDAIDDFFRKGGR